MAVAESIHKVDRFSTEPPPCDALKCVLQGRGSPPAQSAGLLAAHPDARLFVQLLQKSAGVLVALSAGLIKQTVHGLIQARHGERHGLAEGVFIVGRNVILS